MRVRLATLGAIAALAGGTFLATQPDGSTSPAPLALRFYCSSDSTGPVPGIDWRARQAVVSAIPDDGVDGEGTPITTTRDAAQAVLDAERLAVQSHLVRNGNGPRTADISPPDLAARVGAGAHLVFVGPEDEHHGHAVQLDDGTPLLCPECLSPVHAIALDAPDGGT